MSTSFVSAMAASHRHVVRLRLLVPLAIVATVYLYLFPVFHGCAFPVPPPPPSPPSWRSAAANTTNSTTTLTSTSTSTTPLNAFREAAARHLSSSILPGRLGRRAPFRLLALGDPQLEGDTSIPNYYCPKLPHLWAMLSDVTFRSAHPSLRERVRRAVHNLVDVYLDDLPLLVEALRKRIDLWGNDYYLGHNFRTLHWWARPTHVAVLGDLLGSQWIDDAEFDRRGSRFWNRVVRGAERVPDEMAAWPVRNYTLAGLLGGTTDDDEWARRAINVAGNHDIGYAGDLTEARLGRFERMFGKANYELRFGLPVADPELSATLRDPDANPTSTRIPPELRVVVLNDMNLDTPALVSSLQEDTYRFINAVIDSSAAVEHDGGFTLVLAHVPLHKPAGVCVDAPLFSFFDPAEGGGVREQNMLSLDASKGFLEGIYGLSGDPHAAAAGRGRRGVILNGHDHAGCDTYHFINQSVPAANRTWEHWPWARARDGSVVGAPDLRGVREITVRSMMGDFGGFAGLLSVWFDEEAWEWRFEYDTCAMGTQHGWWIVHILDVGVVLLVVVRAARLAGWDVGGGVVGVLGETWRRGCEGVEEGVDWVVERGVEAWRGRREMRRREMRRREMRRRERPDPKILREMMGKALVDLVTHLPD